MATSSPIALILGAGPNIGQSVVQAFKANGYKIAIAARTVKEGNTGDQISIPADFSDPKSIEGVFATVKASLGIPSVVVYNAALQGQYDNKKPLAISLANFERSLNINTTSVFAAAQQAVQGFEQLPQSASKTFIFTGNTLNSVAIPGFFVLGVGKSATAHLIEHASIVYAGRGIKFYYADQRLENGQSPGNNIDGEAHAKLYVGLTEGTSQGPWRQTFVKGIGYKDFTSE